MNEMSSLKAIHHPDKIEQFKSRKLVYPVYVEIDPVAACNHDCSFCRFHAFRGNQFNKNLNLGDTIKIDKMMEILWDCADMGVKAVQFVGGGEPSLHPNFESMLQYANLCNLEIGLISNGVSSAWKRFAREITYCLNKNGQWVRFSLDAATKDTYDIIHRGRMNDFDCVTNSIKTVCKHRNDKVTVGISFVVVQENVNNIVDASKRSVDLGADYIRFAAFVPPDVAIDGTNDFYDKDLISQIRRELERIPDSINFADDFSIRHATSKIDRYEKGDHCYFSCMVASIGADLNLYPCCVWKYHPDAVIGSLEKESLKTVWESAERHAFYSRFDISEVCNSCYLKPKNDVIKYLINEPKHVNFL